MGFTNTLNFIMNHPLNRDRKLRALGRFFAWQVGSRILPGSVAVKFVNQTRLLIRPGMKGATQNLYTGLHEFEDMSFVLHLLRKDDLFVDVGANVGSYTVLAGGALGAKCLSIEPIPDTFEHLIDNIYLNRINENVIALNIGVGETEGTLRFTSSLDAMNHVLTDGESDVDSIVVPVKTLSSIVSDEQPVLIKVDVEGLETAVVAGSGDVFKKESLAAVIMELNGSGMRYGYDEKKLHAKMLEYGFKTFAYSPMDREMILLDGKNTESGNTIYVRDVNRAMDRIKSAPKFIVNEKEI